ncbi:MAG: MATE family efflux transporter [Flavitalea sp.]
MSFTNTITQRLSFYISAVKQSLNGVEMDYTIGSLRRSVMLLAIPMMLEMIMESVFALVDLYFVGHLPNSSAAIQTVGLTESVLTIIYSLAIGISMAATAVVARRIGEKNPEAAAKSGAQAIVMAIGINIVICIFGLIYAKNLLLMMGASAEVAENGKPFISIMIGGSFFIMLLFLINGVFRGAGNAAIAMKSLWVANITNIILCPLLIRGFGPIPAFGVTGAAIATTAARATGVAYQLYHLFGKKGVLKIIPAYLIPDWKLIKSLGSIAAPGVFQFIIGSCSWIFLAQLVATTGGDAGSAGYLIAVRLLMFFLLPAWGLSNAAATLVGQNLGAKQIKRAEQAILLTAKYNTVYMGFVTLVTYLGAPYFVAFFSNDPQVQEIAKLAVHITAAGYVFYGIGMVLINSFNGAGDTWTPTWVNLFCYWLIQVPLSYTLSKYLNLGATGVFVSIPAAEIAVAISGIILYRRGKWKRIKV